MAVDGLHGGLGVMVLLSMCEYDSASVAAGHCTWQSWLASNRRDQAQVCDILASSSRLCMQECDAHKAVMQHMILGHVARRYDEFVC